MGDHQADLPLLAERHTHTRARRRAASIIRRQIVEQSRQRHVNGDFEDRQLAHDFPAKTGCKGTPEYPFSHKAGREKPNAPDGSVDRCADQ